jgi:hypothetical protein
LDESGLSGFFFTQFQVYLLDASLNSVDFTFDEFAPFRGAIFIFLPHFESKNIAQHFLTLTWILLSKLVSFALQKERCVDKGIVIETQRLLNARLGIARRLFGQRSPTVIGFYLKLEHRAFIAR